MREVFVTSLEAGQRLDRFLGRILKDAPKSFLYRMLRKKNITLNGKKADGSEKLKDQDVIRLYFSEETLERLGGTGSGAGQEKAQGGTDYPYRHLDVLYEDANVLIVDKPAGILSQKAKPEDISMVEYVTGYLLRTGALTVRDLAVFRPGVCNRLDRNTTGVLTAGKTTAGLQALTALFRDCTAKKYYCCIVRGEVREPMRLDGYLLKDQEKNQVKILQSPEKDAQRIVTAYRPIHSAGGFTLLEVHLVTGRSHQIRAHLSSIGLPVLGDPKYGDERLNADLRRQYGIRGQMLHSRRLVFPESEGVLAPLSGRTVTAPLPAPFVTFLREEMGGLHGDLEF